MFYTTEYTPQNCVYVIYVWIRKCSLSEKYKFWEVMMGNVRGEKFALIWSYVNAHDSHHCMNQSINVTCVTSQPLILNWITGCNLKLWNTFCNQSCSLKWIWKLSIKAKCQINTEYVRDRASSNINYEHSQKNHDETQLMESTVWCNIKKMLDKKMQNPPTLRPCLCLVSFLKIP